MKLDSKAKSRNKFKAKSRLNSKLNSFKLNLLRKAQVSMEYLIIFTIAFTMTLPLIVIYAKQTSNIEADVTNAQIYKVATKISDYSEQVYYMGEPSRRTLNINFPDGINSVTVSGTNIIFNVTANELTYTIVKETSANLTGNIQNFPGQHIITFRAEGAQVNITDN